MSTDPNPSLAPNPSSEPLRAEVQQAVAAGLGNFSLRELLGLVLTTLGQAERQAYLARSCTDKGNGSYPRSLKLGSIPLQIEVPRTRTGGFRPTLLPPPYQRDYPEETQVLLLALLASCRSLNAAKTALRRIGLSGSEEDLEAVARELLEELELRNTRPLDPDLLALFLDAKYIEVKEGDRLRPASIYLVVGLGRDGKKRVLASLFRFGRENLEEWKNVLRSLIERGLRRVLLVVHDNSGGYFQSQDTLKLKLGLAVTQLETGRWRRAATSVQNALDQFNALFQSRFEKEESSVQTQNS